MRKHWIRLLAPAGLLLLSVCRADAGTFFLDLVGDDGNLAVFDVVYDPEVDNLLGSWAIDIIASPTATAIAGTQDDTGILGTGNFPIGNFSDTIRQPEGIRYGNTSFGLNVDIGTAPIILGTLSVTYNGVTTDIRSENVSLAGSAIVIENNTPGVLAVLDGLEPPSAAHYMEYKVKESDKKVANGALPKGCTVTLDDTLFDFADGETTAENYELSKAKSLGLPADKNGEGGVDLDGTHLLGLQAKPSKLGVLPVVDGKFPKGRKHAKRVGVEVTISNPTFHDGSGANTVRIDTNKVTRLLVPANKDLAGVPGVPVGSTDHYKCYKAKVSKVAPFGTLQDAKGKELKNLQVLVEDQFGDGNGHATYGDARLFDLKKVAEICNPVTKTNIDTVETDAKDVSRTTACTVAAASVSEPQMSLLCWGGKVASKAIVQPWDGADKGTAIDPKQGKHTKFALKTGNPLYLGHQFSAPERVDTLKEQGLCFPVEVTDPGTPAP